MEGKNHKLNLVGAIDSMLAIGTGEKSPTFNIAFDKPSIDYTQNALAIAGIMIVGVWLLASLILMTVRKATS